VVIFGSQKGSRKKVLETLFYSVLINKHLKVQSRPDDGVSVVDEKLRAVRPIWK